jgi:hypothetical protein
LNWKELCASEEQLYKNRKMTRQESLDYGYRTLNQSQKFVRTIIKPGMTVLDLGGSGVPWFAYLAADNGAKVTVYDIQEPLEPDVLQQKGITYIQDTLLNFHNFGSFDLVFCRGLSPPQKLADWHDSDFMQFWDSMLAMSPNIYWIQMSAGHGIADKEHPHFINHRREYFQQFFGKLGLQATVRKYGYMSFEIGKVLPEPSGEKQELQGLDLIKWIAYQMQNAGDTVKAPEELHRIVKVLYEDNFRLSEFKIKNGHEITDTGYLHDSYFLIDEQEDNRFTADYQNILNRV